MRVEPRSVGSVVHVVQRGARGLDIVRDTHDHTRFGGLLFYLNDSFSDPNWLKTTKTFTQLERPEHWPDPDPLVRILAWTLLPNHFHLLLEEIRDNGISKFMQRLCGSMSMAFNAKYSEKGSLFQGGYKSRTVDTDEYLSYLAFYIQVKNVFELYPGGLSKATFNFNDAWLWASRYQFSSFSSYATKSSSNIIDKERFQELLQETLPSKEDCREMLVLHMQRHDEDYVDLSLEPW
ncbi:MAG: transposase [bacterium]|nr:transposase [bacterium]